jgi:glucose dehydrogenase
VSNVYKSLLKVQSQLGAIKKDEVNPFFKSQYVTLNGVREAVVPLLNKEGLVLLQPTVVVDGKQYVRTSVIHAESGESVTSDTEVIAKAINDAQQVGSGISYARRYGLMSLLCLAAEDDDGNSASGKTTAQQSSVKITSSSPAPTQKTEAKSDVKKPSFARKSAPAQSAPAVEEDF